MFKIETDKKIIEENVQKAINTYGSKYSICAVIKNRTNSIDLYDSSYANKFADSGIRKFGISHLSELLENHNLDFLSKYCQRYHITLYCWTIDINVIDLGSLNRKLELFDEVVIYARNEEELTMLRQVKYKYCNKLKIGIVVDLGMNRGGFPKDYDWSKLKSLDSYGGMDLHVMTHCWYEKPLLTKKDVDTAEQAVSQIFTTWKNVKSNMLESDIKILSSSFANSYVATLAEATGHMDWVEDHVRLGCRLLFGDYDWTVPGTEKYKCPVQLYSKVTSISTGEYGYDASLKTNRPKSNKQIVTVACGYSSLTTDPTYCWITTRKKSIRATFKFAMNEMSVYEIDDPETDLKIEDVDSLCKIFTTNSNVPIQRRFTFGLNRN